MNAFCIINKRNCERTDLLSQFRSLERRTVSGTGKYAIELLGVTKRFGEVVANDNVNLTVRKGRDPFYIRREW